MLLSKKLLLPLGLAVTAGVFSPAAEAAPYVYTNEHVDYSINYGSPSDSGIDEHTLLLTSRDEDNLVEYPGGPATLAFMPEDEALTAPGSGDFAFLGDAGDPVWIFPQSNDPDLPFMGFSTEDKTTQSGWSGGILDDPETAQFRGVGVQPGQLVDDLVSLELTGMNGPAGGDFFLYNTDFAGTPNIHMDTSDGIGPQDGKAFSTNVHEHFNFAFTEPGLYELTFQASGTPTATGELITSDPTSFYFGVGTRSINPIPLPSTAMMGLTLLGGLGVARKRRGRRA